MHNDLTITVPASKEKSAQSLGEELIVNLITRVLTEW